MQYPITSLLSVTVLAVLTLGLFGCEHEQANADTQLQLPADTPYILVLGISQDGGTPQAGDVDHAGWTDPTKVRLATSIALVDPISNERWLFEATPDFRKQLYRLDQAAPRADRPGLDGIFLTHAHMGHYTGLMFLGHESMGAQGTPVFTMPKMAAVLAANGPWSQLVNYKNIALQGMEADVPIQLNERLTVTPFLVPHRQEFSEVVGFRIDGPSHAAVFIPDIDSWTEWDDTGTHIEDVLASVDVAWLDATFYANGEIPGRDMSGFPHPFITTSMDRFAALPDSERNKVRFIHLNHTNPALWPGSELDTIRAGGFHVAEEGEKYGL